MKIKRGCLISILAFLLVVAIIVASLGWMWHKLTDEHSFSKTLRVSLPYSLGGSVSLAVNGNARLDLDDMSLTSEGSISASLAELNISLPDVVYSVLDNNVKSEHVSSMLGRVSIVADTAGARQEQNELMFVAQLSGEFLVRERREYKRNEEQPDAGSLTPISGEIRLRIGDPAITEKWHMSFSVLSAKIELDAASVRQLKGKFGPGDSFARLVETLLNSRLSANLGRLLDEDRNLRVLLKNYYADYAMRNAHKFWAPVLYRLKFDALELDRCPVLTVESLSIGYAAQVRLREPRNSPLEIPNLILRNRGC